MTHIYGTLFASSTNSKMNLMEISYPLVHEGKNLNGHIFTREEMAEAYETLIGTPIDLDHSQTINDVVGKHTDAEFKIEDGKAVIYCKGYIYADFYPELAAKLRDGVVTGISMETHYEWAERTADGMILHGLNFLGAGIVRTPADPKARVVLSENKAVKEIMAKVVESLLTSKGVKT